MAQHHAIPPRQGVSASCVALPHGPWPTLLDFLDERMPAVGREVWRTRMAEGLVLDAQGTPITRNRAYEAGHKVYYFRAVTREPALPFEATVLYQDTHLVVADKPHFMPVTPTGTYVQNSLLVRLKNQLSLESLSPLHRIDRDTAGLVLFSVRPEERDAYQALFRDRQVHKVYQAVAPYRADLALPLTRRSRLESSPQFFRSHEVEGEANSETHVSVLAVHGKSALYRLEPVTGQRHQLRIHMAALGLPLENDPFYPEVSRGPDQPDDHSRPMQLLAQSIAFTDPITQQARAFQSRLSLRLSA
jgi:tRNA pseudouridine32 synthase/23S rRNA pseudouridine746 synthase